MTAVLLSDAAFAAAAGIGFGIAFNPPKGKLLLAGLFAAAGHSLRLWLMLGCGMNICPATLIGAFAIGILGIWPAEFPAARRKFSLSPPFCR